MGAIKAKHVEEEDDLPKKAKKKAKGKVKRPLGPIPVKVAGEGAVGLAGHNSGEKIPALCEILDEILASDERTKGEAKLKRDLRNRAKNDFGILSSVLAHEVKMRKMDPTYRMQFESGCHDIKVMTGYQHDLDLKPDTIARTEDELVDPSAPRDDVINRKG